MVANGVLAIIQLITASKGNLMKKFTLLASLLTLGISTAQAIVIPDLFGSYKRGAEAARQANRQSGYYGYYPPSPSISYLVARSDGSIKKTKRVSIQDGDLFCWSVDGIDQTATYTAIETFGNLKIGAKFDATSGSPISHAVEPSSKATAATLINQKGDGVNNCWWFKNDMPTGKYTHQVTIGGVKFSETKFTITK